MKLFNKFNLFSSVLLLVVLILNSVLFFQPMIGQVGFENSIVNSIIIFVVTGLFSISFYRKNIQGNNPAFIFIKKIKFFSAVLAIPLFLSIISTIIFSKCPFVDGLWFYLVIAAPSVFVGTASGYLSFYLNKKYSYVFFILILFMLIFSAVWEIYRNPQIYFYNPIIGFFPGTIYDEDIIVDWALISYRLINLIIAGIVLFVLPFFIKKKIFTRYISAVILFAFLVLFYYLKPQFGFSTDDTRLRNTLTKRISTKNFEIYFSEPKNNFVNPTLIALHHEYYFEHVLAELGLKPAEKNESYIFKSSGQKRFLFGAGNANVAKPWSGQIFLNISNYDIALEHELVHVAAAEFGSTIFKVADGINSAMIEGIAMAIENNFDGYPIHYAAALAYKSGFKINMKSLFSGLNFFSNYSSVSYIYAGSFVKFLIEKYGMNKVTMLYGDLDFMKIFGENISTLDKKYTEFLNNYKIKADKNRAKLYFAGTPLFKKFCPRTAASEIKSGWEYYNKKEFQKAAEIFDKVYSYSASYEAITGFVNSNIMLKNYFDAIKMLSPELEKFRESRYFFNIELMLADLNVRISNYDNAMALYDSIEAQSPHINYDVNVSLKKTLLNISPDTLKIFLEAETNGKFDMLFRLNNKSIVYNSIPAMLDFAEDSARLKLVCEKFKDSIKVNDKISSHAAFKMSNAAELLGDFNLAKYFAIEALKYKEDDLAVHSLEQNLKRINWLINYSDELKPFFVYR